LRSRCVATASCSSSATLPPKRCCAWPAWNEPDTARSLNNLAGVLRDQGDLDGARPLYERARAIREVRLGADHPDTVRSRERLAAVVAELDNQK
jgi:hypothetical protein